MVERHMSVVPQGGPVYVGGSGKLTEETLAWLFCPNCLWVMIGSRALAEQKTPVCARWNSQEPNVYGGQDAERCPSEIYPVAFDEERGASLWTALKLGGTNAVVEMLEHWHPEDVGLPNNYQAYKIRESGRYLTAEDVHGLHR